MYKIVDEKPIQKTTREKPTQKRPSLSLLVLFPTILLILILGATMGTVIGFKSQLKSFEDRIALLEEPTALTMNHNENNLDSLQKNTAEERPGNEPSRRVDVPEKIAKKRYSAQSPKLVKVSAKTPKNQYRTARSGDTLNSINAPL
jgi:hypothetical protein